MLVLVLLLVLLLFLGLVLLLVLVLFLSLDCAAAAAYAPRRLIPRLPWTVSGKSRSAGTRQRPGTLRLCCRSHSTKRASKQPLREARLARTARRARRERTRRENFIE